jgi:hypothetical protein
LQITASKSDAQIQHSESDPIAAKIESGRQRANRFSMFSAQETVMKRNRLKVKASGAESRSGARTLP